MNEITVLALQIGVLVLLWLFVLSVVGVLRGDLYGTRVITRRGGASDPHRRQAAKATPKPRRGPTHVVIVAGSLAGTSLPLTDNGLLIGRNPECSLVLNDDYSSGRHARIYWQGDGWILDDLGSTNGTFLDDHRVGEGARLDVGSRVRIGQTVLELRK